MKRHLRRALRACTAASPHVRSLPPSPPTPPSHPAELPVGHRHLHPLAQHLLPQRRAVPHDGCALRGAPAAPLLSACAPAALLASATWPLIHHTLLLSHLPAPPRSSPLPHPQACSPCSSSWRPPRARTTARACIRRRACLAGRFPLWLSTSAPRCSSRRCTTRRGAERPADAELSCAASMHCSASARALPRLPRRPHAPCF